MTNSLDPDAPAFPVDTSDVVEKGLTLRQYYAGQALMGMLARTAWPKDEYLTDQTVRIADAMLISLAKSDGR